MEAYLDFARVYDIFMDETPYEEWHAFLIDYLKKQRIENGIILDLGCGTGTLTNMLQKSGYDMIGIDNSEAMLSIAIEKLKEEDTILYLLQDMREFELYGTVSAVISVCDSINYLLEEEDVIECFRLVNNYLDPKGIFIFDFNSLYKYEVLIGEQTIAENREECSFIWENYFHKEEHINEYDLTLFVKEEDCYQKFCETHFQRGYTLEEMKQYLQEANLEFIEAFDADTKKEVHSKSERIYCIARECGK
ncbi:MAG: class I SAM-dependent DNA methyltransferase [Lachnospiraceae bacterium]